MGSENAGGADNQQERLLVVSARCRASPAARRFGFLSDKKKRDFAKFERLVAILGEGRHLTRDGLQEVLHIRSDMNDGGAERRKYSDAEILLELGESSEAIR